MQSAREQANACPSSIDTGVSWRVSGRVSIKGGSDGAAEFPLPLRRWGVGQGRPARLCIPDGVKGETHSQVPRTHKCNCANCGGGSSGSRQQRRQPPLCSASSKWFFRSLPDVASCSSSRPAKWALGLGTKRGPVFFPRPGGAVEAQSAALRRAHSGAEACLPGLTSRT